MWGFKQSKPEPEENPEHTIEEWSERAAFLERAVRNLLILTKEFTFDVDELHTADFKKQLDHYIEQLPNEWRIRVLGSDLEQCQQGIQGFAKRQLEYIEQRESEYREIIENLVSGLANSGLENEKFCKKMESCGQALEKVARLDDIRKLKSALNEQLSLMNREIKKKRDQEGEALKELRSKVSHLHLELQSAVEEGRVCSLTRVGNRRAFDENLQRRYEQSCLFWKPFAIIMIDIDNFKKINDTYGHTTGDHVLTNLAQCLRGHVRSDDLVARYGGEEFVIILGGSSLRGARKRARALVKVVDGVAFMTDQRVEIPVTISAGVALLREGDTAETLVERADRALYLAKKSGKNRAVCESSLPDAEKKGVGDLALSLLETLKLA